MFSLIRVNRLCMFVKLCLQCSSTVSPIGSRCAFSPLVNLIREQVKSLSSIGLSVVSLSDLKKVKAENVLGKAAHSVVFDKRQPEICRRSQAIVNSETEIFFSDANVSNVYRKGCEL